MFHKRISELIEKHGSVTTFTYILYGDIEDEEIEVLGSGLKVFLFLENIKEHFHLLFDEFWIEQALAITEYRGTSLRIVFCGSVPHFENMIKNVVGEFFETIALKCNFINTEVVNNLA